MKDLYYFTAVFDDDGPVASESRDMAPAGKPCRSCQELTAVLHQDPERNDDCRRVICGKCQGEANREILNRLNPISKESRNGYRE